jgi:hypothetical protein
MSGLGTGSAELVSTLTTADLWATAPVCPAGSTYLVLRPELKEPRTQLAAFPLAVTPGPHQT